MTEFGASCGMAALLDRVSEGDQDAWRYLVEHHGPMVWGAARAYSMNRADAEDVCQVTWVLLAENLHKLRQPDALPAWLATTARREALRLVKARRRETPAGVDTLLLDVADVADGPENRAVRTAVLSRVAQAFAGLSQRCQQLLRVMAVAPDTSYNQIATALGMARGSIGPKRNRCLTALRRSLAATGMPEEAAG